MANIVEEWERLRSNWNYMNVAVDSIDATSYEIYNAKKLQEMYYSGQHTYLHSQVIIGITDMIRHVVSVFPITKIHAQHYSLMTIISDQFTFPDMCFLFGDKKYPNRYSFLHPFLPYCFTGSKETTDAAAFDLIDIKEGHLLYTPHDK